MQSEARAAERKDVSPSVCPTLFRYGINYIEYLFLIIQLNIQISDFRYLELNCRYLKLGTKVRTACHVHFQIKYLRAANLHSIAEGKNSYQLLSNQR